jgi:hypothetical protein
MIKAYNLRRLFLVLLITVLSITSGHAQLWMMRRFEFTFGAGTSYFFSDIGGYKPLTISDFYKDQVGNNLNISMQYRVTRKFTSRLSLSYGQLSADDALGINFSRGYKCLVSAYETSVMGQYYILRNSRERSYYYPISNLKPFKKFSRALDVYTFAGFGALNFNIKSNEKLATVMSKPKGCAIVFPAGAGASIVLSPDFSIGIEMGGRYALSDKVDGFSSAFSQSNDIYYYLNIFLTFKKRSEATMMYHRR